MTEQLLKITSVELRSAGFDEKWLQSRIDAEPTLLSLGDLVVVGKEHKQPAGGRIDFLMRDEEEDTYYEVEVMLGALDESHIIRTIEYWDIERQRRPFSEHRAVIVAELITSRFFNVLRLLNRAVPLIAIQMSAFKVDGTEGKVGLQFIKVLDVIEEVVGTDDGEPDADRAYWLKRSSAESIAVMDSAAGMLKKKGLEPKLTYNRTHVAMGTTGRNFCWFHPRRSAAHCHFTVRFPEDDRDKVLATLVEAQVPAVPLRNDRIRFTVTPAQLEQHGAAITDALMKAEKTSRT